MKTDSEKLRIRLFLRHTARIRLRDNDKTQISAFLSAGILRDRLISEADAQGVSGFLCHHFREMGKNAVPEALLANLEARYRQNLRNTLSQMAKAFEISELIRDAGISAMAIQGITLAGIYRDPGLRPMNDLDLMAKASDLETLKQILHKSGYAPVFPYPNLLKKEGFLIDLHTHLMNVDRISARRYVFPENLNPLWERARPLFYADCGKSGKGLLRPETFDNFTALCAHALKHSYSRLIWLTDLHELALTWEQDAGAWKRVCETARFWHQEKTVLYALLLCKRIFGLAVPARVQVSLGLEKLCFAEKHCLDLTGRGFSSEDFCLILWLCQIGGWGKKWRFLKENLFPGNAVMTQVFPESSGKIRTRHYISRAAEAAMRIRRMVQLYINFMKLSTKDTKR